MTKNRRGSECVCVVGGEYESDTSSLLLIGFPLLPPIYINIALTNCSYNSNSTLFYLEQPNKKYSWTRKASINNVINCGWWAKEEYQKNDILSRHVHDKMPWPIFDNINHKQPAQQAL
jgi:hypothetical protein